MRIILVYALGVIGIKLPKATPTTLRKKQKGRMFLEENPPSLVVRNPEIMAPNIGEVMAVTPKYMFAWIEGILRLFIK